MVQPLGARMALLSRQCSRAPTKASQSSPLRTIQRRSFQTQDVAITRTGKAILSVNGGRSSIGGHTITVLGSTGFLGRYIVNRLARSGNTVVIPFRSQMEARHLKVAGDLGRVVYIEFDLRNKESLEESIRHSDIVINLIGREYPTKNFDLEDVHVWGAERIAETVAKYDVDRFIHVSSYNADVNSPSEFYRTKGEGEKVVRSIFPETTIVRPAPLYGHEDKLLNMLAGVNNVFTSNNMQQRFNPVHAIDVGQALETITFDDSTAGETYELYGPTNYSLHEIADLVTEEIMKTRRKLNMPPQIRAPVLDLLNKLLWWDVGTGDMVAREFIDQKIDPLAKTFKDLGIEPAELKNLTYQYLLPYRSSSYYDLPPMTEKEKREEKKFLHVIDDQ